MSARDKLYAYAGTPSVLPESMLDAALDAYRAEVLASDGQAYDGELAMYRELVRTLRVVVRDDRSAEKQRAEVRRLLHHHAGDDAAAREGAKGKSSRTADATPDFFQPGHAYTEDAPFRAPEDRPNFQCLAVAIHPTTGTRRALGFEQPGAGQRWSSSAMRDEEWADGWADVTKDGDR